MNQKIENPEIRIYGDKIEIPTQWDSLIVRNITAKENLERFSMSKKKSQSKEMYNFV